MLNYFWVGLGGALGSMGRFWLSGLIARHFGEVFPLGTLLVNVSGSFVIGCIAAIAEPGGRWVISPSLSTFLMIGICGGYTTFSTFSLQTLNLVRDGHFLEAILNAVLSLTLCLLAVWLGHWLALSNAASKGP